MISNTSVYLIKRDNGDTGWLYYLTPQGKLRHTTSKRRMGSNIIQESLRGNPDNIKVTIIIEKLPDNREEIYEQDTTTL